MEFYYFIYVTQCVSRISNAKINQDEKITKLYFTIGDESVTKSRLAITKGYNNVRDHGKDLLMDIDVLNYLNTLIPDDEFYWLNQILNPDFKYRSELYFNLNDFLKLFKNKLTIDQNELQKYQYNDLGSAIKALRLLLEKRRAAPEARYAKNFEAIVAQGFSKRRGRLGKTFTLDNQTVLMITAVIVGQGKMLLTDVFENMRKRGIFFDRITESKVIELYENANVLEKLSDSGDAQYVRGIL